MRRRKGRPVVEYSRAARSAFGVAADRLPAATLARAFSTRRRRVVLSMLRGERADLALLGPEAVAMYVISALICDEVGVFRLDDVHLAMRDAVMVGLATQLLREVNHGVYR